MLEEYELPDIKECITCLRLLPSNKFHTTGKRGSGYKSSYCNDCERERKKLWRQTEPGKISDRNSRLKSVYKIDIQKYNELMKKQNGKCYLCGVEKKLHIDHCHLTDKVRKLLCEECNRHLGYYEIVKSKIEIYEKYIEEHK